MASDGIHFGRETLLRQLESMAASMQKARSNVLEAVGGDESLAARHRPLLFGERNCLTALLDLLDEARDMPEHLLVAEYMNMLGLCDAEPAIRIANMNVGTAWLPDLEDAQKALWLERSIASSVRTA